MSIKNGDVVQGRVTKITKYGAFIKLPNNSTGLCHISEVSNDYVKDVADYLKEDQEVKVKVLNIKDDGKIELSIKALTKRPEVKKLKPRKVPKESFEDMLSNFLKSSDEKMKGLKQRDQRY